jgi:GT2 family glycosyltransferase
MSQSIKQLNWAVVIPTYQRQAVLLRCLRFVALQTLPPKEIIVVDASHDWESTREKIQHDLAIHYPNIIWHIVQAKRLSSAAQRNQGIALATAEIVFLIDDDSFMYPDCAEEVICIYAQDTAHQVAGIMPKLEALPPPDRLDQKNVAPNFERVKPIDSEDRNDRNINQFKMIQIKLRGFAKRLIKDDDIFIPYDFTFPKYTLPETFKGMATHPVPMIHGARMSYRREILAQVQFEETLERYAVNEDNDVCYRASRLGMLLHALKARICHAQVSEGRLTRLTTTALWGLNQAVLHRIHSPDLVQFKKRFRKLLWQRLFTQTIKDILERRWTLPSTRGIWFALRHWPQILSKTPAELRVWYPQFQKALISQDKMERGQSTL